MTGIINIVIIFNYYTHRHPAQLTYFMNHALLHKVILYGVHVALEAPESLHLSRQSTHTRTHTHT